MDLVFELIRLEAGDKGDESCRACSSPKEVDKGRMTHSYHPLPSLVWMVPYETRASFTDLPR